MIQEKEVSRSKECTDLLAWKEGHQLALGIYKLSKTFPKEELFALTSQMRRPAVSITSNIAEGFGRQSVKEKVQFYYMAHGSLVELKNQLLIVKDLEYISSASFPLIEDRLITTHKLLRGLIKKTKSFLNPAS